jgi:hypothetical protein
MRRAPAADFRIGDEPALRAGRRLPWASARAPFGESIGNGPTEPSPSPVRYACLLLKARGQAGTVSAVMPASVVPSGLMPTVGTADLFEQAYIARLRPLLVEHGQIVRYENDRAALDLGLHLYDPAAAPGVLSQARVWFQLKGIGTSMLTRDDALATDVVRVPGLRVEHVKYWFGHPEPVYLVVYVEALEQFVAADVRELVEARGGVAWLRELESARQRTVTLHVRRGATFREALGRMPRHRSMRVDGPEFRGRPLGHRFDPLRCELDVLSPDLFRSVVWRLLDAHGFVAEREIDPTLFGPIGEAEAVVGRVHYRYEWTCPLFTQFGYDENSYFRAESPTFHAQGKVLAVVHPNGSRSPRNSDELYAVAEGLQADGVEHALVFFNASEAESGLIGGWRSGALAPFVQFPQGLGSLAYNVLIATNVFVEFVDRLSWRVLNVQ